MNSTEEFLGGLRRGEMAADHFTIVANLVARDKELSCRAKGLFLNMASHRDGFTITEEFLASQCSDGVKAIRSTLLELRAAGYIYRSQQRTRYPQGTKNAKGKDISGALGPYQWFVTDKPDEIAAILTCYSTEQHQTSETAAQHKVPQKQVVMTSKNPKRPESKNKSSLPAAKGGSDDQAKGSKTAGHHYLPKPPGGFGSSIEDYEKKTINLENKDVLPRRLRRLATEKNVVDLLNGSPTQLELISNPTREPTTHRNSTKNKSKSSLEKKNNNLILNGHC